MNAFEVAAGVIKKFEGLYLTAYVCPGGILTIGYGSTRGVRDRMVITEAEADSRLMEDMRDADDCIEEHVRVELSRNQRAALISFIFNVGCGNFRSSTLLRLLNASDYAGCAKQFQRWDKAKGKVLAGLAKRRLAERELFEQHNKKEGE